MDISALFRRKGPVNLLPKDSFESSAVGRVLAWALVFGKWSVIVTQLIVVGAFLLRFGLDRKLTDLRRSMNVEISIIESYSELEREFRLAQSRLEIATEAISTQKSATDLLAHLATITPIDVWYERMTITDDSVTIAAYSSSISGFSLFIQSLKADVNFSSVSIGSISSGVQQGARLQFEATLTLSDEDGGGS